jgi:hypothetical protein
MCERWGFVGGFLEKKQDIRNKLGIKGFLRGAICKTGEAFFSTSSSCVQGR